MKQNVNYLFLLCILFLCSSGKANVILTQSNATPVTGTSYFENLADTNIQEGLAGTAVAWAFNNVNITTPFVRNCVDPANTPYLSSFPGSNVAMDDSGRVQFLMSSANDLQILGTGSSTGVLNFNTPISYFTFPFGYNSITSNSNISGSFPQGTVLANYTTTGDAYGSLTINGITLSDVLRVKIDASVSYNYTGIGVLTEHSIDYAWFDGIHPLPIFEITYLSVSGLFSQQLKEVKISSLLTGTTDLLHDNQTIKFYPNPAQTNLEILSNTNEIIRSIKIINSVGDVVKEINGDINIDHLKINIEDLAAGSYFLEFVADKRTVYRFVKI